MGSVAELAFRFARELEARGISKGDRVLLWGDNCAEWVGAFFAACSRGCSVPMDRIAAPDFCSARNGLMWTRSSSSAPALYGPCGGPDHIWSLKI